MRRLLTFPCEGAILAATLDEAEGNTGLLIVSGGNEIRVGAHRGMAHLAADIAAAGYPVLRFDRRGIGDSEGENGGFEASGPDIAAAVAAFRANSPTLQRIVAFGNCDAASALVLHDVTAIDSLVIANPWVIETTGDDLPPPAAIRARYAEKIRDRREWLRLLRGGVNMRKLAGGLVRLGKPRGASSLAARVGIGLARFPGPVSLLIATRDNTAIAFADQWDGPNFAAARARPDITVTRIDSASHSFAGEQDYIALTRAILDALA
jgi:exosortase A-associated hydrolase 1